MCAPNRIIKVEWKQAEEEFGFDSKKLMEKAFEEAAKPLHSEKKLDRNYSLTQKLCERTITPMSERKSVFSRDQLINQINQKAVGFDISAEKGKNHINLLEPEGRSIKRKTDAYISQFQKRRVVEVFTTPETIELEQDNKKKKKICRWSYLISWLKRELLGINRDKNIL